MGMKRHTLRRIIVGWGLAVSLAFAGGCSKDGSTDGMKPMSGDEHQKMQNK